MEWEWPQQLVACYLLAAFITGVFREGRLSAGGQSRISTAVGMMVHLAFGVVSALVLGFGGFWL